MPALRGSLSLGGVEASSRCGNNAYDPRQQAPPSEARKLQIAADPERLWRKGTRPCSPWCAGVRPGLGDDRLEEPSVQRALTRLAPLGFRHMRPDVPERHAVSKRFLACLRGRCRQVGRIAAGRRLCLARVRTDLRGGRGCRRNADPWCRALRGRRRLCFGQ